MSGLSTPVAEHLRGRLSWLDASQDLKTAFKRSMRGRKYGWQECHDAWEWFAAGWYARVRQQAQDGP